MVGQHLTVWVGGEGQVSASRDILGGVWDRRMRSYARALAPDGAPIYSQYAMDGCVALCRAEERGGETTVHQLLFRAGEDVEWLFAERPIDPNAFVSRQPFERGEDRILPALDARSLAGPAATAEALDSIAGLFAEGEGALASLIACVRRCARGPALYTSILIPEPLRAASERGRALMEILFRALPIREASALGYAAAMRIASLSAYHPVMVFGEDARLIEGIAGVSAVFRADTGELRFPIGMGAKPEPLDVELSAALFARDFHWVDRVRGGEAPRGAARVAVRMPSYEAGMSLLQYVADWIAALEAHREGIDDDALNRDVASWGDFVSRVLTAGERAPSRAAYVRELARVIACDDGLRQADWLRVPDRIRSDLYSIFLHDLAWEDFDGGNREDRALIAAFVRDVDALQDASGVRPERGDEGSLALCRIFMRFCDPSPDAFDESVSLLRGVRPEEPSLGSFLRSARSAASERFAVPQSAEEDAATARMALIGSLRPDGSGGFIHDSKNAERFAASIPDRKRRGRMIKAYRSSLRGLGAIPPTRSDT